MVHVVGMDDIPLQPVDEPRIGELVVVDLGSQTPPGCEPGLISTPLRDPFSRDTFHHIHALLEAHPATAHLHGQHRPLRSEKTLPPTQLSSLRPPQLRSVDQEVLGFRRHVGKQAVGQEVVLRVCQTLAGPPGHRYSVDVHVTEFRVLRIALVSETDDRHLRTTISHRQGTLQYPGIVSDVVPDQHQDPQLTHGSRS